MRIFVTGGTGFIGSHFINRASAGGFEVLALRRSEESLPRINLVKDPQWLTKEMSAVCTDDLRGCQAIVHLAAVGVSPQVASWEELLRGNIVDPSQLFEVAHSAGISRWVVGGTFAEYGLSGARYELIPENASLEPTYPYAASKAAFFSIVHSMAVDCQATLAYFRIFSAYGDGQHSSNFWPSLRHAALTGKDFAATPGEQIRDFIQVETIASTILSAVIRQDLVSGKPWVKNLGSGKPVSIDEFGQYWWKQFLAPGRYLTGELPYRPNEVMRYVPRVDPAIFESIDRPSDP